MPKFILTCAVTDALPVPATALYLPINPQDIGARASGCAPCPPDEKRAWLNIGRRDKVTM